MGEAGRGTDGPAGMAGLAGTAGSAGAGASAGTAGLAGAGGAEGAGAGAGAGAGGAGLRERKKARTYRAISDAAVALFLERGFDRVSVAEVAAAAEVSKPTLFRYFPAKEDLVVHRFADHRDEAARVVAARAEGVGPLTALHRHLLDGLDRRDPVTGLSDEPSVLAFHRLLYGTPSLVARLYAYQGESERALAEALGGDVGARLAAGQVIAVLRVLAEENWRRIEAGESADAVHPDAVAAADVAFRQLAEGLADRPQ